MKTFCFIVWFLPILISMFYLIGEDITNKSIMHILLLICNAAMWSVETILNSNKESKKQ